MRNTPVGSLVGAVAGLVFVLVNAGAVPGSLVWRVAAVAAALAVVWFVVVRGPRVPAEPPSRAALRTYAVSVVAMVVLIPLGASVITNVLERPSAVLPWVVLVVGAHFVPFARAFGLPVFTWLAASLVLVGLVGGVATLVTGSATAAGWTGVAAGFVLLFFSAVGPRMTRASSPGPAV